MLLYSKMNEVYVCSHKVCTKEGELCDALNCYIAHYHSQNGHLER